MPVFQSSSTWTLLIVDGEIQPDPTTHHRYYTAEDFQSLTRPASAPRNPSRRAANTENSQRSTDRHGAPVSTPSVSLGPPTSTQLRPLSPRRTRASDLPNLRIKAAEASRRARIYARAGQRLGAGYRT
ncbi:hypothetical protein B0H15DRAFT_943809 [Mycena belliarum]|uniref:Uncharacterized protein n=1 Tax=Mycena belliarum TaxID=1033014 RepID=A0AAD6UJZ1_9AGAR|nr:hypothetical protein B0H15DRAFT_943809 [Mycena belliae]